MVSKNDPLLSPYWPFVNTYIILIYINGVKSGKSGAGLWQVITHNNSL